MKNANEIFRLNKYREELYKHSKLTSNKLKIELNKNAEDITKFSSGKYLLINLNIISCSRAKIEFELLGDDYYEYNNEIRRIIEASKICGVILNTDEDYLLTYYEKIQKYTLLFQESWKYFYQQILCCNTLYLD